MMTAVSAAQAEAPQVAPDRIIAVLTGDWNEDGNADAALLIRSETDLADLVILTGDGIHGLQPAATASAVIFAGPMAGQAPTLSPRTPSSFVVTMEQTAIGRTPWNTDITIAFRSGAFVVAGFTHNFYDRLEHASGFCDVNLLSGDWELRSSPGAEAEETQRTGLTRMSALPIEALSESFMPAVCAPLFN